MTIVRKHGAAKAGQAQNAGTSQAVPLKAGDNLFDRGFHVEPYGYGYTLVTNRVAERAKHFLTLDDLMTFLASEAIAKMQGANNERQKA